MPFPQMRIVAVALCGLIATAAAAQDPRSTADGVFSEQQARSGEQAYRANCAACHGLDLRKIDPEAPDLTDGPFRFGWQDKTLAERFERIRTTMPRPAAGSLDDQTYLDIIAYLLSANGSPAGAQPLEPDREALAKIVIALPAAPTASGRRRR
ncbi:MAG: c-type cytochrome [Hyphomicrobiales bacterium]|nr:c-type cytochrome [Hyphomicrobiales bacterium]